MENGKSRGRRERSRFIQRNMIFRFQGDTAANRERRDILMIIRAAS